MSQVAVTNAVTGFAIQQRSSAARVLGTIVFVSMLGLFVITAIPYGTAEVWWKAFFVCAFFSLAVLWLIEGFLSGSWKTRGSRIFLPALALAIFALLQTVQLGNAPAGSGGTTIPPWHAISVDPYQTRFFALQLLALILAGVFLLRYVSSERRLRIVVNVVIAIAVASAVYGMLRQTAQHEIGFGLPLIKPNRGYGQFVNRNHFAFLMEMAFGLTVGLLLGGGVKRDQSLIYVAALLLLWVALVLSGSRGGLLAMVAQVVTATLLFANVGRVDTSAESRPKLLRFLRLMPMRIALVVVLTCGVVFGTLWIGGDQLAASIQQSQFELDSGRDPFNWAVSRGDIWRLTWKMFAANPIVGVGMGAYWAAVPAFHDAAGTMTPQEAHNDYLELLASGGLVGMAIGVWFAVGLFRRTRQNLRSPNRFRRAACFGAAIGITGVAVHSLTDFGLHMIVNALLFTALIVIATAKAEWATPKAEEAP